MNTTDDRDRSIDKLLRQSFEHGSGPAEPGSSCLDAETLGAWAEGSLSESGLATVETHLSDCARCQRIVAVLAKMPAVASEPQRSWWWQGGVDLRWLVPIAAGATAVALWVAVPSRETPSQPAVGSPQSTVGSRQSAVGSPQAPAPAEEQVRAKSDASAPKDAGALKSEAADARLERRDALKEAESPRVAENRLDQAPARASAAPAAAPAAAAPAAAAAETVAGARPDAPAFSRQTNATTREVVSPAPLIRWRVGPRGLLQYSANGGAAWESLPTGVTADLIAGASPSPSVCWVVGRAGTVLLTIDGRRFDRLSFPQNVDLTAVRATDARTATVGSADGRVFTTTDGGATWTQ